MLVLCQKMHIEHMTDNFFPVTSPKVVMPLFMDDVMCYG